MNYFPVFDDVAIFIGFCVFVSAFFYWKTRNILKSAHGVLIIVAYVYSGVIRHYSAYGASIGFYIPMYIILILSLGSVFYSLNSFKGKRWQNLFLGFHLFTVSSGLFILFVGSMAIGHDWI